MTLNPGAPHVNRDWRERSWTAILRLLAQGELIWRALAIRERPNDEAIGLDNSVASDAGPHRVIDMKTTGNSMAQPRWRSRRRCLI